MTNPSEPSERDRALHKAIYSLPEDNARRRKNGEPIVNMFALLAAYRAEIEAAAEQRGYERGLVSVRAENNRLRQALADTANGMTAYVQVAVTHVEAIGLGVKRKAREALALSNDAIERNEQEIRNGE